MKAKLRAQPPIYKPSGKKHKRNREHRQSSGESWVQRLQPLAELRETYLDCHREIARRVCDQYLQHRGRCVELGAGLGQLRHWVSDWADGLIQTEPDAQLIAELEQRFPDSTVFQARAESLPFEAASCSAVLGLCVLDVVDDVSLVLKEINRVLEPGGVLIHFLDMAPKFETTLARLAAEGQIVLPNVFADPSASAWPEDLLVTGQEAMNRLLTELEKRQHPLIHTFGHYFESFRRAPFDAKKASLKYEALSRTPEMRELLKTLLTSGYMLGFRLGLPPPRGMPTSSGKHLASLLGVEATKAGLAVELNEMVSAWSTRAIKPEEPCYRSLALGHERRGNELPQTLLCAGAAAPREGFALVEAATHVFVARRGSA